MKISLRFTLHLIISFMIGLALVTFGTILLIDFILPAARMTENNGYDDLIVVVFFLLIIILSAIIFGRFFGKPLIEILTWLQLLAKGNYQFPYTTIKKRKGKLSWPYSLYEEVIVGLKELTMKLKQAEESKEELERLKKEWAAGISHDLKTPLTYINGYSALLLQDKAWSNEEKEKFLKEINQKGLQMEELIKDLNFSFKMSAASLPVLYKEHSIVEFVRRLIANILSDSSIVDNELTLIAPDSEIKGFFDDKLMYRALENIYMNAIIHNPPKTAIQTTIQSIDDTVIIIIEDNGNGMDKNTVEHIFNRYYSQNNIEKNIDGTGLGMSIAKQIISAHNGTIVVESEPNFGTKMTVSFPLTVQK